MTELATIVVDGRALSIEHRFVAGPDGAPLVVFLHEGLGSVAMWKDFPDRLCAAGGLRGLVYSRPGYGRSTPRLHAQRYAPDFMHRQARSLLPALLAALDIDAGADPPWLFGHSDGGSIALIHAATFPERVAGAVVLAPHLFVEPVCIDSIAATRELYETGGLRRQLGRYHEDVESAFRGWNDAWLDPSFRDWNIEPLLPSIACPVLAIQGTDDEYGTMAQIDHIAVALPDSRLVKLERCGHSPHRDRPEAVIDATLGFVDAHREHRARTSTTLAD